MLLPGRAQLRLLAGASGIAGCHSLQIASSKCDSWAPKRNIPRGKGEITVLFKSSLRHSTPPLLLHSVIENEPIPNQGERDRITSQWEVWSRVHVHLHFTTRGHTPRDTWEYLKKWGQCLTLQKGSKCRWNWIIGIIINLSVASMAWENWNNSKAISMHLYSPLLYLNCSNKVCMTSPGPSHMSFCYYCYCSSSAPDSQPEPVSAAPNIFSFLTLQIATVSTSLLLCNSFKQCLTPDFQPSEKATLCIQPVVFL